MHQLTHSFSEPVTEPDFNGFSVMSLKISQQVFLISAGKCKSVEEVLQNVSEDNFLIFFFKKSEKATGRIVTFLMTNTEEITTNSRLSGYLD